MSLTLYVDGERWRAHLKQTLHDHPGLLPVAKGNGYGFGLGRLAKRAAWLGVDTLAVGTYHEVAEVSGRFPGDIMVLEPWRPFRSGYDDPRLVHTVGRTEDLHELQRRAGTPRVVLEGLTSIRRHGFNEPDLKAALATSRGVRVEGVALHLPIDGSHHDEVERWVSSVAADTWFVSHLRTDELERLRTAHHRLDMYNRVGTALWLGDRGALQPRATVLDVHRVRRGDRVGYRQRGLNRDGTIAVVSGGTAHGIGMSAPTPAVTLRQRAVTVAKGSLDAAGWATSPYVVDGKRRWFVEPPHMQVSMIFVPDSARCPAVGDEIEVRVRYTATAFDHIVID